MWPPGTSNGSAPTAFSTSASVRTNVGISKPKAASSAGSSFRSMAAPPPDAPNDTLPDAMWVRASL